MFLPSRIERHRLNRGVVPVRRIRSQIQRNKRIAQPIRVFRSKLFSLDHLHVDYQLGIFFIFRDFHQLAMFVISHFECVLSVRKQGVLSHLQGDVASNIV